MAMVLSGSRQGFRKGPIAKPILTGSLPTFLNHRFGRNIIVFSENLLNSKQKHHPTAPLVGNEISRKWYALIMNLSRKKIVPDSENKEVEVMNLHTGNETEECLKRKGIYPCYHMNKKYWVSIILDDTLKDDEIFSLIELSYQLSKKK